MSDDNKVKLLRIQSSLLEALREQMNKYLPGSLAYEQIRAKLSDSLIKYKDLVTEIDRGIYHELQNKINEVSHGKYTYEEELKLLEELDTFYQQFVSVQNNFIDTYNAYGDDKIALSPIHDMHLNYYLKRKDTIKNYLKNKNIINEYKERIEENNKRFYEQEKIKYKLDKTISDLDADLKKKIYSSEGRILLNGGTLKYTNIINELKNIGLEIDDNGIDETLYNNIEKEAKDAKETLNVATISYEVSPSPDKKSIIDEIRHEEVLASYKLLLAKFIRLVYSPSNNYEEAISKRENILDLLDYRKKFLNELNIKFGLDPFSRLNIKEQLERLKIYESVPFEVDSLRRELSEYNIKIDELENSNKKYLLELDDHHEVTEEPIKKNDLSFNSYKNNITTRKTDVIPTDNFILDNQVIDVKPSEINFERSLEKARKVAKRVYLLLTQERKEIVNVNPELVIETKQKDNLFKDEDPFINDNNLTIPETTSSSNQEEILFTNEDPFIDDNQLDGTTNNQSDLELFTSEDPFIDDNNIIPEEKNTDSNQEDPLFKNEDPFIDDNKQEDLFNDLEPFGGPSLFSNRIEEDIEMPDMSLYLDENNSKGGRTF